MAKKKITETGPVGLRGIRNTDIYNELASLAENGNNAASTVLETLAIDDIAPLSKHDPNKAAYYKPQQHEPGTAWADLGNSKYDNSYVIGNNPEDVNEIRYENQPWYDALANGIGKMVGTAATTFISSLAGIPVGIGTAIAEGRWSGLWDNAVTQAMSDVDDWMKENMVNYKSKAQQESPWWSWDNLSSMSFWADDVLANMGFTLGAAASMAVGSGGLGLLGKAMGITDKVSKAGSVAKNVASALYSATGEGMIEARNGVDEWSKIERQKLEDSLAPEKEALRLEYEQIEAEYAATRGQSLIRTPEGGAQDPAYLRRQERLAALEAKRQAYQDKLDAGYAEIAKTGLDVGNKILAGNQALLTLGNMIQFSKLMNKSFDNARHMVKTTDKMAKPVLTGAQRAGSAIEDGYKITGSKGLGRTVAATKGLVTEGSEEMNQQWIQYASGYSSQLKDVNDYWKARLDPDSYKETAQGLYTWGEAVSKAFDDSWGDANQWEQFVIGGLTGMAGSYAPTKLFNQDKTKSKWNPFRYGEWSGGAIKEVSDFDKKYRQYEQNIGDLNERLKNNFQERTQDFVGRTYLQKYKDQAAAEDDQKAWKDADDKQIIMDIQAFLRAGKLDDLRAIYNSMGDNLTDEDIEGIIARTTKEVSAEEDKQEHSNAIDGQIAQHQKKKQDYQDTIDSIMDNADNFEGADERTAYLNSERPRIEELLTKQEEEQQKIEELEQDKNNYVGVKHSVGPFLDNRGNRKKSNDEIRAEIKHNAEELNRKVDSYLESINAVNEQTNGNLTNEQEDNLAYLHNVGKEKIVRTNKIMGRVRKNLPDKFLYKTNKSLEQLAEENSSSDLAFTRDEKTPEGYVIVDTSKMSDANFANFFIKDIMLGGNIDPKISETADERAAREEEEKNLSEDEKKKRFKERITGYDKKYREQRLKEAKEQSDLNWDLLADNFESNYRANNNGSYVDMMDAFFRTTKDIDEAVHLFYEAGEYNRKLNEYRAHPEMVEEEKQKAEEKNTKEQALNKLRDKFEGKSAKEINQGIADGTYTIDEVEDLSNLDISGVSADDALRQSQKNAKDSGEIRQKVANLKKHIQEQMPDTPTPADIDSINMAMNMADIAGLEAASVDDLNINMAELQQVPLNALDGNATDDEVDSLNEQVRGIMTEAFDGLQRDEDLRNQIPENTDVKDLAVEGETGKDPVTSLERRPLVFEQTPKEEKKGKKDEEYDAPIPESPLSDTEEVLNKIREEIRKLYEIPSGEGAWRTCTTRHPYHRSTGTYHENVAKEKFGENSIQYKRSKAIYEYLNSNDVRAFDRQENSSENRIRKNDTIHFAVKNLAKEIYEKEYSELTSEEKPYALVIIMLDAEGNVVGDLPLAQLEPSDNKEFEGLQNLVFSAYDEKVSSLNSQDVIVDDTITKEGFDNLGLTFKTGKKPLLGKVNQVMRGVIPESQERNTLNDVANGASFELGVRVVENKIATKRKIKDNTSKIVAPNVGSLGQPFLLIPTPSGEKIAWPFYMVPFDAAQHVGTEMYKMLNNAISHLMETNPDRKKYVENFEKHIDVLEGLLQVKRRKDSPVVTFTSDSASLHLESLIDPDKKIDITVPYSGDRAAAARAFVEALSGTKIHVSLEFLNRDISTSDRKADYNRLIGEIADINMPKATTHSVNGWFTVALDASEAVRKKPSNIQPKKVGKYTITIKGRSVTIDADSLIAYDPQTGEAITDDEDINLMLAEIRAEKLRDSKMLRPGQEIIQITIGGETRSYNINTKKFVKQKSPVAATTIMSINDLWKNPAEEVKMEGTYYDASGNQKQGTITVRKFSIGNQHRMSFAVDGKPVSIAITNDDWEFDEALVNDTTNPTSYTHGMSMSRAAFSNFDTSQTILAKGIVVMDPEVGTWYFDGKPLNPALEDAESDLFKVADSFDFASKFMLSPIESADNNSSDEESPLPETQESQEQQPAATAAESKAPEKLTAEQATDKLKAAGILNSNTTDAWNAVPDDLKVRFAGGEIALQLSYKGKKVTATMNDLNTLKKELKNANAYAKRNQLKVSEAVKPMQRDGAAIRKEQERKARQWLAKNLPMLSSDERVQFVDKLVRGGDDARKMWGSYRNGVIEILNNAPMGTTYHEAFHYVMDMLLNNEEKAQILNAAREAYGKDLSDLEAEERLAESFRRYAIDQNDNSIIGKLKRWFKKLMDKITRYNRISDTTINQLFWKINNGQMSQVSPNKETFDAEQQRVLREIKNIRQEKMAWNNLSRETKQNLKDSGMTQERYSKMSLDEKEQWVKCRG